MNHQRFMFLFLVATTIGSIGELSASSRAARVLDLIKAAAPHAARIPRPTTRKITIKENEAIWSARSELSRSRVENKEAALQIILDAASQPEGFSPDWAINFMALYNGLIEAEKRNLLKFVFETSKMGDAAASQKLIDTYPVAYEDRRADDEGARRRAIEELLRTQERRAASHSGAAAAIGAGQQFYHPGQERMLQEAKALIAKVETSQDVMQRALQDLLTPKQAPLISEHEKNTFIAQFEPLLTHQQANDLAVLLHELYNKKIVNAHMLRNYLTQEPNNIPLGLHTFITKILNTKNLEQMAAFAQYVVNLCNMSKGQARQEIISLRDKIASKDPMVGVIQPKAHRAAFVQPRDDLAQTSPEAQSLESFLSHDEYHVKSKLRTFLNEALLHKFRTIEDLKLYLNTYKLEGGRIFTSDSAYPWDSSIAFKLRILGDEGINSLANAAMLLFKMKPAEAQQKIDQILQMPSKR